MARLPPQGSLSGSLRKRHLGPVRLAQLQREGPQCRRKTCCPSPAGCGGVDPDVPILTPGQPALTLCRRGPLLAPTSFWRAAVLDPPLGLSLYPWPGCRWPPRELTGVWWGRRCVVSLGPAVRCERWSRATCGAVVLIHIPPPSEERGPSVP